MPPRNFTDEQEAEIARLYLTGLSAKAIARQYGLGHHISITAALRRQGVMQRPAPERNRLYKLNPYVFDDINSEEKAYSLGFIFADGHVARERSLILAVSRADAIVLERLKNLLESESPVKDIISNQNGKWPSEQSHIEFTDQYLGRRLTDLGMISHRKQDDISWRKCFLSVPERLRHDWVRGWFDGDGSAHINPAITFCGPEGLLLEVRRLIANETKANPDLAVTKHSKSPIYYLRYSGRNVAKMAAGYLYNNATIYLERKKRVVESW